MDTWPENWMKKAFNVTWDIVIGLPLALMILLYSRVVYTLWFKKNNGIGLNDQQSVCMYVKRESLKCSEHILDSLMVQLFCTLIKSSLEFHQREKINPQSRVSKDLLQSLTE